MYFCDLLPHLSQPADELDICLSFCDLLPHPAEELVVINTAASPT